MARLKVYVTPIGFHDAYVAATSQKAALEAWGADANLFARGAASIVTDATLAKEPLANPGKVIKRLRGTEAEQIAALGKVPVRPKARGRGDASPAISRKPEPRRAADREPKSRPKKLPPRPSRKALDAAEEKLTAIEARFKAQQDEIAAQIAQLQQQRKTLRDAEEEELARAVRQRDAARERYQVAVERWASAS